MPASRVLLLLLVVGLSSVAGIWTGERFALTWNPTWIVIPITLGMVAAVSGWRFHRGITLAATVLSLALFATGFLAGDHEVGLAFNGCNHQAQEVRARLARFHQETGAYPEYLDELGAGLPGELLLSPSLLRYERTETGYHLEFRDALVRHRATETTAFQASK